MESLIDQFIKARKDFLETLDNFPEDKAEEVLFDKWSLKDVLAHLVGWDVYFTNALKSLRQNKPVLRWGNINSHNKRQVEKRTNLNYSQVYKQFVDNGEEFINKYRDFPAELKNKLVWPDKKYTPLKFLKVNIHHYKHHHEKIKKIEKKK